MLENRKVKPDDVLTSNGMTGLMIACSIGDYTSAKMFIKAGAEINKMDGFGRTALHFA